MKSEQQIIFGAFRLDLVNQCLWRGEQTIALPPKEFAVLLHLVRHPGQLVTKEELIEAVWSETNVTDGVLKVSVRKLRAALEDDPKAPQFIETAHRRGYRFIGRITEDNKNRRVEESARASVAPRLSGHPTLHFPLPSSPAALSPSLAPRLSGAYRLAALLPARGLVGRETALAQMQSWLQRAFGGERQVVFVTGEAGIGKTTLVEAFLQGAARDLNVWVGQGQCLEQYGAGEAYLPVLEAVSRLCQEPGRERLVDLLRRHAPTWLQQMPWLSNDAERESLHRAVIGATRERMLREIAEALEALTAEIPLVLVLEDLHWSDYSTLDLVSYLARRRKPARLMLIATYRPVEVALSEHPLKGVRQELQAHRQCEELPLEYLSEEAVGEYLAARYPKHQFSTDLTALLHARTEGNPFFLVNAVDYLQAEGAIAELDGEWMLTVALAELEVGVPESIRQMVEKQIERLNREQQRILEVASVAGAEFPAAAIAAGLEHSLLQIEEQCEELERCHQFLRATGVSTLPNGIVTARYGFIHALYQEVLYQRVAVGRRVRLHQLIGERAEEVYGTRSGEVAAELAMHFEQGHDYRRAVKYLLQAAHNHFLRYANREAVDYLSHALELAGQWPESEATETLTALLEERGLARRAMGDMAGAAADFTTLADYTREQGRLSDEVNALIHLATVLSWVDRERCLAAAEGFVALSRDLDNQVLQAHARGCWGYWHVLLLAWGGEHDAALADAVAAARQAGDHTMLGLHLARYSFFECLRSDYSAASRTAEEAGQLALELSDAHSYLLSKYFQAWALLHLGRWGDLRRIVAEGGDGLEMAERNEHHRWAVLFRLELAWLHEQAFDFERTREICEQAQKQAREMGHPYTESLSLILLGMAHLGLEQRGAAFRCFSEVTARSQRERSLMDWVLQIPLHYALSRYWLAQGNPAQARQEAERACELATPSGERTYLALGHQTLAEVAMIARDWDAAEAEITNARAVLQGARAPLAEWRVCATAAQLYERLGRNAEALWHWQRSAEVLNQLAGSLDNNQHLRRSLMTNPTVQAIQRRARAG